MAKEKYHNNGKKTGGIEKSWSMRRKIKEKHDANKKTMQKKLFSGKQKRGKKYNVNARHFFSENKRKKL